MAKEGDLCKTCKIRPVRKAYKNKNTGKQYWKPECGRCYKKRYGVSAKRRLKAGAKEGICDECGFVAKHPCQLDVDHIDGNRDNDDPSNYRTLCANCHRLKTQMNQEFRNDRYS